MKWYTAVGVKMASADGAFCVRVGRETKNLLGVECYVWNALLWSFVEETEIYERMVCLLKLTFPEQPAKTDIDREEYSLCFRRLLSRGLIAFRESEDGKEAAEELFRSACVACVGRSLGERFLTFCEGVAGGTPLKDSAQVFKKNPLEKTRRELLREIQGSGKTAFSLEGADQELIRNIKELHQNRLLFIQSVKEGTFA